MFKKLTLLAMSVAALLALAAPAAQATGPLITTVSGEAVKTLTATSTNNIRHFSIATIECTTTNLHLNITGNSNTTAMGNGTGTMEGTSQVPTHTGHCGVHGGAGSIVEEVTSVTVSDLHLTKHGAETTGTVNFSHTVDWKFAGECKWGGTLPVKKAGTSTINLTGEIKKIGGSGFCPAAVIITADFTLRDEFGIPVTIH